MSDIKKGDGFERWPVTKIIEVCNYQYTLDVSLFGLIFDDGNFSPPEFITSWSGTDAVGSLEFQNDALIGLRYLLDRWHKNEMFSQGDISLLYFLSGRPAELPFVDDETGDWLLKAGWHEFQIPKNKEEFYTKYNLPQYTTGFEDWKRYFVIGNLWGLLKQEWKFNLCETDDCFHYTLHPRRFHSESCGSKHRMRMLRSGDKGVLAPPPEVTV